MRTRPSLIVLVIALTLICGIGVAGWIVRQRPSRTPVASLAAAIGDHYDFGARLSGGFQPPSESARRRSAGDSSPAVSPEARIAIAQLEIDTAEGRDPRSLAALGVAQLVAGDVDRSIALLDEAASIGDEALVWSDLAAAYLVKAERMPSRRIEFVARGLDASARSMRKQPTNEARFNYALAVDALSPYVGLPNPWNAYLPFERDAKWLAEGHRLAAAAKTAPAPRHAWESQRKRLREALANDEVDDVREIALLFPEASTEVFEGELLAEWARGVVDADPPRAASSLAQARILADALVSVTHDSFPRDALSAIVALGHAVSNQAAVRDLARGHIQYAEGIASFDADDYTQARNLWESAGAAFDRARSPFREWSHARLGTLLFNQRQLSAADRLLIPVEVAARKKGYGTLLGRTLWSRGLVALEQWRLTEALDAFRESAACFESSSQRENAESVYNLLGWTLNTLGEHQQSWEYIGRALDGLGTVRKAVRRYTVLYNASLFASRQDLLEAALVFQDGAVHEAEARDGAAALIDALTNRAAVRARRGEFDAAARDLRDATERLHETPDSPLKDYHVAELARARADLDRRRGAAMNVDEVQAALSYFARAEPSLVPSLYLTIARGYMTAGRAGEAANALDRGIAHLERQQADLRDEAFRVSYFDEAWNLFPEMVDLQLRSHDEPRAFEYAERARGRSLLRGEQPVGLSDVQKALGESAAMLYYALLPDRLLVWTITSGEHHLSEVAVGADRLTRLIAAYRAAISQNSERQLAAADELYDVLLRPVRESVRNQRMLVVVADAVIQQVPFAALREHRKARYVVEDFEILQSPSASFFTYQLSRQQALSARPLESALLVGNPGSGAVSLPGAEAEARVAAAQYPRREVLVGPNATKRQFLERAPLYDVVHFGGHAFANVEYPLLSRLSFSSGSDTVAGDPLFAHEIARMHFTHTRVVVLAACSTAVGGVSRGEGVMSVARPFMAAGAPLVVASQWDVDDAATERLFTMFHREFAKHHDAVAALRAAQLAMIRSLIPGDSSPSRWGAFIALGTGGIPGASTTS
jgi:CHAT domain-containing protein